MGKLFFVNQTPEFWLTINCAKPPLLHSDRANALFLVIVYEPFAPMHTNIEEGYYVLI